MAVKAVLLDLGNVILGVDFHRVFTHWANAANLNPDHFHQRWAIDTAYEEHECGRISFDTYTQALAERFEVILSPEQWLAGWNNIWTQPYTQAIELLPQVAEKYPLFCFTNTNQAHTQYWRRHYPGAIGHFEHVFVSSEIGHRKPVPAAFHYVCNQIGWAPDDVVFLDDTRENVAGARQAGLQAHHVPTEADVVARLRQLL